MTRYRTRPVPVEAVRCREAQAAFREDWDALPDWLADAYERGGVVPTAYGVYLPTPDGSMLGLQDDWLVRDAAGKLRVYKDDVFAATFEPFPVPPARESPS